MPEIRSRRNKIKFHCGCKRQQKLRTYSTYRPRTYSTVKNTNAIPIASNDLIDSLDSLYLSLERALVVEPTTNYLEREASPRLFIPYSHIKA